MAGPTTADPETCTFRFLDTDMAPFSYLYSSPNRNHEESYLFEDPQMDEVSYLDPIVIWNKKVNFTLFHQKLALYDGKDFILSLPDFLKKADFSSKVSLPNNLSQELLDKIAIIANYLHQGKEYEYLKGSAQQQGEKLIFLVKKGSNRWEVTLPSFQIKNEAIYLSTDKKNKSDQ